MFIALSHNKIRISEFCKEWLAFHCDYLGIEVNAATNSEFEAAIQLIEDAGFSFIVAVGKNTVGGLR